MTAVLDPTSNAAAAVRTRSVDGTTTAEPAASSTTMVAMVGERYGSADGLELRSVDRPTIGPGQVLVRVRAAGVSRGAWHLMAGYPYAVRLAGFGVRAPKQPIPGLELAGVVEEVGAEVTRFQTGDEVFGMATGTFAEYAAVDEDKLAHKLDTLTFVEAAALPDSASVALQAVRDHGHVKAGDRVLVIGASGGVGTSAVQIAKAAGAEVTAVASTGKLDLVRSLGADHVVDYTATDATDGDPGYDVIIDTGGNTSLRKLRGALAPEGTLVIVGGEGGGRLVGGVQRQVRAMARSAVSKQTLTSFISEEHHRHLDALTELIDAGQLRPCVDRTYPLADAPEAMRRLEAGRARGKLVIEL